MEATEILTLINTGGLVGALVYGIHLGLTGRVIPRDMLDEIIVAVVREVIAQLREERRLEP